MSSTKKCDDKIIAPLNYIIQCIKTANEKCDLEKNLVEILTMFNDWIKVSDKKFNIVLELLKSIFNFISLIDDICHETKERQGFPTAHMIFELPQTLNCAHYILVQILLQMTITFPEHIVSICTVFYEEMFKLLKTFNTTAIWQMTNTFPSEEEYLQVLQAKYGSILNFGVRLMQQLSENKQDFTKLVNLLAVYYQIKNDYIQVKWQIENNQLNFQNIKHQYQHPVLHFVNLNSENITIQKLRNAKDSNDNLNNWICNQLQKSGSLAYTKSKMEKLLADIQSEIAKLKIDFNTEILDKTLI